MVHSQFSSLNYFVSPGVPLQTNRKMSSLPTAKSPQKDVFVRNSNPLSLQFTGKKGKLYRQINTRRDGRVELYHGKEDGILLVYQNKRHVGTINKGEVAWDEREELIGSKILDRIYKVTHAVGEAGDRVAKAIQDDLHKSLFRKHH
jgi:hypothetical protein